jgi:hypothetical protein
MVWIIKTKEGNLQNVNESHRVKTGLLSFIVKQLN